MKARMHLVSTLASLAIAVLVFNGLKIQGQTLSGSTLVADLRQGGYVIVIRHASSPREVPDQQTADSDNTKGERQLDAAGRTSSAAMGKAMRELKIPIGEVLSSPTGPGKL
jgi:hypothetical protein